MRIWLNNRLILVLFGLCLSLVSVNTMAEENKKEDTKAAPVYMSMKPTFVINLVSDETRPVYLQLDIEVMARSQKVIDNIRHHMPRIRHELLLLLSDRTTDDVRNLETRGKLRKQSLETIQNILIDETGEGGLEKVLFTKVVYQ